MGGLDVSAVTGVRGLRLSPRDMPGSRTLRRLPLPIPVAAEVFLDQRVGLFSSVENALAHRFPADQLAKYRCRRAACVSPATNRQVDRVARRRNCTSVAELRQESSCRSRRSGRGVD